MNIHVNKKAIAPRKTIFHCVTFKLVCPVRKRRCINWHARENQPGRFTSRRRCAFWFFIYEIATGCKQHWNNKNNADITEGFHRDNVYYKIKEKEKKSKLLVTQQKEWWKTICKNRQMKPCLYLAKNACHAIAVV